MFYDYTVPIPEAKGKITQMKKGKQIYIQYETGRTYFPDRKYTIPNRVSIGRLDLEHPDLMYPNEKFPEYFPDTILREERTDGSRSCSLRIGPYVIIKKIVNLSFDLFSTIIAP